MPRGSALLSSIMSYSIGDFSKYKVDSTRWRRTSSIKNDFEREAQGPFNTGVLHSEGRFNWADRAIALLAVRIAYANRRRRQTLF